MGFLWKKMGNLVTWVIEKAEQFNYFFALVFTSKCFSHTDQAAGCKRSGVRLRILKVQKSMGLIKCICGSWGNWWKNFLSNCPLYFRSHGSSVKFQLTWKRKIWLLFLKRENQKDLGNYRPVSLTLCLARSLRRSSWELCSDT